MHKFNRVRVNFIRQIVQQELLTETTAKKKFGDLSAIDVGCGAGILSESLGRLGFGRVVGIDPTPKCIELATEHLAISAKVDPLLRNVSYENTTLENKLE